jgi:hypothetical protein
MVAMPATIKTPPLNQIPHIPTTSATALQFGIREAITTPDTISINEVTLNAGVTYEFIAGGSSELPSDTLVNPVLGIYTSDFQHLLVTADSGSNALDPGFTFKPNVTGVYGIGVESAIPGGVGSYNLEVRPISGPINFQTLSDF